jgi:two-component system response regulator FlrC
MIDQNLITLLWDSSSSIDEPSLEKLTEAGFEVQITSISEVLDDIEKLSIDSQPKVLCLNSSKDRRLSESYIQRIKDALGPKTYLILRTERDDIESAIAGVRAGSDDVLCTDASLTQWLQVASSARMRLLKLESFVFVDELSQNLLALVERVGASDVTALLQGPTGSGKEVLARLIHDFSARRDGPFVPVNCAALPESLAESLLFGHVKGSFTGATKDTEGFFTQADGGTLFLDEIGELQPMLQAKLLRVIQEREVLPVGSAKTKRVDVRIVSATNRDLRYLATLGEFREDLYFRLSTFRINVPSLAARPDDILPLANYFIVKHCRETQRFTFTPDALSRLISYDWPGNVS